MSAQYQLASTTVEECLNSVITSPDTKIGLRVAQLFEQVSGAGAVDKVGFSLVQIQWNLTSRKGSNTVTTAGSNWVNPTNAQSANNAVLATFNGDTLVTHDGTLQLAYTDYTSKTTLVISLVRLHFYVSTSGTTLNNGDLRLQYNIGASDVLLEQITGNVAMGARVFDITAAIAGDWSKLDALVAKVRGRTGLTALLINYACDAVEVEVIASVTDSL